MAWNDIFGGQTVNPSEHTFSEHVISANLILDWPTESAQGTDVVTDILHVSTLSPNLSLIMPDGDKGSPGSAMLAYNAGALDIEVKAKTGTAIITLIAGKSYFIYLVSNASQAGTWKAVEFAAGASVVQAAQLASNSVVSRGGTLVQAMPVKHLSVSGYVIGLSDQATVLNWDGGVGSFVLDEAGTLGPDWFAHVRNSGTGTLTLSGSAGQGIDNNATLVFSPGESSIIVCDGTTFLTISRTQSSVSNFTFLSVPLAGATGNVTLTSVQQGYDAYAFTGTLSGATAIIFPTTLGQYSVTNKATGAFTLTIKTASGTGVTVGLNESKIVYCDGANIVNAATAGISTPVAVTEGGTGAVTATAALANLGATAIGTAVFQAITTTAARAALGAGSAGDAVFKAASTVPAPDGTNAAPGFSYASDPDTGFKPAAANQHGIVAGGKLVGLWDAANIQFSNDGTNFKTVYHTGNFSPSNYQTNLGYTPVQQGTGVSQSTNAIKIGHDGIAPRITVDSTDFGQLWTNRQANPFAGGMNLPNGIQVRWGSAVATIASGGVTIAYETPFSNGTSVVVPVNGDHGNSINRGVTFQLASATNSTFTFGVTNGGGNGNNIRVNYIAIGF